VENQILVDPNNDSSTFQELYELAQRKFLRQLVKFSESDQFRVFPRLIIIDMIERQEIETIVTKIMSLDESDIDSSDEEEDAKPVNGNELNEVKLIGNIENIINIIENTKSSWIPGFSILCENLEGWHKSNYFFPFGRSLLSEVHTPYLVKIMNLIKQ
jgi:hypothetical protein